MTSYSTNGRPTSRSRPRGERRTEADAKEALRRRDDDGPQEAPPDPFEQPSAGYDLAPPDEGYVRALREELETQFRGQDEQIDLLREVRELQRVVALADEYRLVDVEVRVPTVAAEIERYTARLSLNPPTLEVTAPPDSGDAGKSNATLREQWTEEMLRVAGTRLEGPDTLTLLVDAIVGDGGGWTKFLFDRHLWELRYSLPLGETIDAAREYDRLTEDAKREAGPPFVWASVDVRTVYPLFSGGTISAVLEVQKRPLSTVLRKYRLSLDRNGNLVPLEAGQPTSANTELAAASADVLEYWDDVWCGYVIHGTNKRGKATTHATPFRQHGYRQQPYFFSPGRWQNQWRNRKVGWSVSEAKRWLVEYLSYLLTLHAQVAARDALPPGFLEVPDTAAPLLGKDGKPLTSERWRPGQLKVGRPGERLNVLQFPNTAAGLEKHLAIVMDMIARLETPKAGKDLGTDGSGFNTSLVLSEVRTDEDPLAQSAERQLTKVTRFGWRLVKDKLKERVWVASGGGGWLALGPADLERGVSMRWALNPERPTAKLVENRYWSERLSNKTAHLDQVIEALGDNPDEVREGILMDEVRATQEYRDMAMQRAFQKIGRGDLLQQALAARRLALSQAGAAGAGLGGLVGPTGQPIPPGMGSAQVPDFGDLSVAPNGAGARAEIPRSGPGNTAGAPRVPTRSGAAGIQRLGR